MGGTRAGYWDGVIAEYRAGGVSQEAFCRRRGLSVHSLRAWLYQPQLQAARAAARGDLTSGRTPSADAGGFLPIHVVAERAESLPVEGGLEVPLEVLLDKGRRVAVRRGFDAATLVELLAALEQRPC